MKRVAFILTAALLSEVEYSGQFFICDQTIVGSDTHMTLAFDGRTVKTFIIQVRTMKCMLLLLLHFTSSVGGGWIDGWTGGGRQNENQF